MCVIDHVAQRTADDAHVEHDRRAPRPMHGLQWDAQDEIEGTIDHHVQRANVGELVRPQPPDLAAKVLARLCGQPKVRPPGERRLQARQRLQYAGRNPLPLRHNSAAEPQDEAHGADAGHEPLGMPHDRGLLRFAIDLRLDAIAEVDHPIAVHVESRLVALGPVCNVLLVALAHAGLPQHLLLRPAAAAWGGRPGRPARACGAGWPRIASALRAPPLGHEPLLREEGLHIVHIEASVAIEVKALRAEPMRKEGDDVVDGVAACRGLLGALAPHRRSHSPALR
mmetsp:Transcript_65889/g.190075  ORF Transcript_65889/g.190075 Transcript_65889/m.190075 type:complete len:282 (-) Transcript_65889:82-927(-)